LKKSIDAVLLAGANGDSNCAVTATRTPRKHLHKQQTVDGVPTTSISGARKRKSIAAKINQLTPIAVAAADCQNQSQVTADFLKSFGLQHSLCRLS
jgi:hypothetical protein